LDHLIESALKSYKDKLEIQKEFPLSVSGYSVEKPWGHEQWLEINEFYAYKLIHMKAGSQSSLQMHEFKYETNFVIEGRAKVLLENDEGTLDEFIFGPKEGWSVPLKRKHRVIAITDYTSLEVSTPHLDDVIRFSDDTNRPSGKLENEHKVNK
tara:strand:+ start:2317 stop:2775 length:459 start_codon:yes stop_codon:yes gene_type:complete